MSYAVCVAIAAWAMNVDAERSSVEPQQIDIQFQILQVRDTSSWGPGRAPAVAIRLPATHRELHSDIEYVVEEGGAVPLEFQPAPRPEALPPERAIEQSDSPRDIQPDPTAPPNPDPVSIRFVTPRGELVIGDRTLSLANRDAASDDFKVLTAPRILALTGEKAALMIGQPVSYLEDDGSGCLRVIEDTNFTEGLGITMVARADAGDSKTIHFDSLELSIHRIAEREPVPGVPFDVGRPIISGVRVGVSLTTREDVITVVPVYQLSGEVDGIILLMRARVLN